MLYHDHFTADFGNFRTTPIVLQYLGPSVLGANSINDVRITAPDAPLPVLIADRYLVLRSGKKRMRIDRRA